MGATVNVSGTTDEGDDYFRSADTNANGEAIFSVPAGVYTVEITDVPSGYAIDPATSTDTDVAVAEGETVNLDNTVLEAGATKVIDTAVPGRAGLRVRAWLRPGWQAAADRESGVRAWRDRTAEGLRTWAGRDLRQAA